MAQRSSRKKGFWSIDRGSQRFHGRRRAFIEQLERRELLAATPLEAALISIHGEDLQGKDGPLAKAGFALSSLYHE